MYTRGSIFLQRTYISNSREILLWHPFDLFVASSFFTQAFSLCSCVQHACECMHVCAFRFVVLPCIRTVETSFKFQIKSSFQSDNSNKIKMRASGVVKNP